VLPGRESVEVHFLLTILIIRVLGQGFDRPTTTQDEQNNAPERDVVSRSEFYV